MNFMQLLYVDFIDIFEEIGSNWLKLVEIGLNGVGELSMFEICKSQVHLVFDIYI